MAKNFFERYNKRQMRRFKRQFLSSPPPKKLTKAEREQIENTNYTMVATGCLASIFYLIAIAALIVDPLVGSLIFITTLFVHLMIYYSNGQKLHRAANAVTKLINAKQYSKAINLIEKARANNIINDELLGMLAFAYYYTDDYSKVIDILKDICTRYPQNHEALLLLGSSYFHVEQFNDAIEIMQQIPSTHDQYIKALQIIGASFYQLGKTDIAIDTFKKAPLRKMVLNDDLLELHYNYALLLEDSGDLKTALKHYKIVISHDINYRDAMSKAEELEKKINS